MSGFPAVGGSEYTGPLDLVPGALLADSMNRALAASMLGQDGYTLRRSSDDAELAFAYDATTGEKPLSAINTWKGEGDAFCKTLNDHSGNDYTQSQATAASQPLLSVSGDYAGLAVATGLSSVSVLSVSLEDGAITILLVVDGDTLDGGLEISDENNYINVYSNWNVSNDVYVETANVTPGDYAAWITSATLTDQLNLIKVVIAANGDVTVEFNGADANATRDGVASVPPTWEAAVFVTTKMAAATAWQEKIIYEGTPDTALAEAEMATYYGITLP